MRRYQCRLNKYGTYEVLDMSEAVMSGQEDARLVTFRKTKEEAELTVSVLNKWAAK